MATTRLFPLADILSVTTGRLLSRRHMDGIYDLTEHMTGGPVWTHQLPRAADACRPALLHQHPALKGVAPPENATPEQLGAWLTQAEAEHGRELPVAPLPDNAWKHRNPFSGLIDIDTGTGQAITVITSGRDRTPKAS